jgi:hypothetical protein
MTGTSDGGVDVLLSSTQTQGRVSRVTMAMLAIIAAADPSLQPQTIHVLPNWKTPVNYLETNYPVVTLRVGSVDLTEKIYGRAMPNEVRGNYVTFAWTAHVWGEKSWQLFDDVDDENEALPQANIASDIADAIIDVFMSFSGDSYSGIVYFDKIKVRESEPERGPQRLTRMIISGFVLVRRPLGVFYTPLSPIRTKIFNLDTCLQASPILPFDLDISLQASPMLPISLDTDLQASPLIPFNLDIGLQASPIQSSDLDALFISLPLAESVLWDDSIGPASQWVSYAGDATLADDLSDTTPYGYPSLDITNGPLQYGDVTWVTAPTDGSLYPYIGFWFKGINNGNTFTLLFYGANEGDGNAQYSWVDNGGEGWQFILIPLTSFSVSGLFDWSDIEIIRFSVDTFVGTYKIAHLVNANF